MVLMISSNEKYVDRHELAQVPTPAWTDTWHPLPHIEVIETVQNIIQRIGWKVEDEQFGLARDQQKMFGVMTFSSNSGDKEWRRCVGIRNSHDKSLCVGITAGVSVIVCSNLAFGGTTVLQRRHTSGIDLKEMVTEAIYALQDEFITLEVTLDSLRDKYITEDEARCVVVQAAEAKVIASCDILPVLNEFRFSKHREFGDPSQWSLLNAFTEVSHKFTPAKAENCHRRLTRFFGLDGKTPVLQLPR